MSLGTRQSLAFFSRAAHPTIVPLSPALQELQEAEGLSTWRQGDNISTAQAVLESQNMFKAAKVV